MIQRKTFWRLAMSRCIARQSLRLSLFVGTLLNLINQGSAIWTGAEIDWTLGILNFFVPYAVATYSAVRNEQRSSDV
ncbi:MAG: nitrate/nitrite transporter NrtS [Xanthomonadales bacterium]|nr:nitrate/nitrite transporter NrtS [Xanthomonadales bacterium]